VESDIRDNPSISRFEMPLGDGALAVAYYKVEDGRVVLLHTEVPQRAVRPGVRIAAGAWRSRSVATRREKSDCEVPFHVFLRRPTPRVRRTPRRLIADGRDAGADSAFQRRYLTPIECMSKGNFQFRRLCPILRSTGPAEHTRLPRH
jgi:hypothetical protein